jgi:hypothetical protein
MHTYSLRAFQRYQERSMKWCGLGDLNMTNKIKQNKLPCFIDRFENKFQTLLITNLIFISLHQQLIYALCIAIVHILQFSTIYLRMNVVCLFCLSNWNLSNQDAYWCTFLVYHWEALDEQGYTMLVPYCFDIWWRSYSILNNFFIEN